MMATLFTASPIHAADQSYNLYYVDPDYQIEQVTGVKFKKIGYFSGGVCAITADDEVWSQSAISTKPALSPYTSASSCIPEASFTKYLPFRSNLWGAAFSFNNGGHGSIGQSGYLGIDADGYLWANNRGMSSGVNYGNTPIRLDVKFHDGVTTGVGDKEGPLFLLGVDRNQANTTVAQMPTTGAPTGISTIGLVAASIGLAAMAFGLGRRLD